MPLSVTKPNCRRSLTEIKKGTFLQYLPHYCKWKPVSKNWITHTTSSSKGYTVFRKFLRLFLKQTGDALSGIYIPEIWVLTKTYSQKLFIYCYSCIYTQLQYFRLENTKKKLPHPLLFCWRIDRPQIPILFWKRGEIQLWLIKTTFFTSLLLQIKRVIIKQLISSLRMCHLLNFEKKVNDNTY